MFAHTLLRMGGLVNERLAISPRVEACVSTHAAEPCSSGRSVRLFVVEDGAIALEARASSVRIDHTVVVAQSGGERLMEFAGRAIRRVSTIEQQQQRIARAILLLSPRFDAEATAARVCLARVLRAHSVTMASAPLELLVTVGTDFHVELQAKVVALVDALAEVGRRGALSIAVQFATDGPPPVNPASARDASLLTNSTRRGSVTR